MPFHFSLEAVLRYRSGLERRERLRLQELLAQRVHLSRQIDDLHATRFKLLANLQNVLQSESMSGGELRLETAGAESAVRAAERLRLQLEQLRSDIQLQTEHYRRERQQREILEALREHQLLEYQLVEQRREQAMLDELYLMRRNTARQRLPT